MGAGLRPDAKATEPPPDPTVGAPVPDSTTMIEHIHAGLVPVTTTGEKWTPGIGQCGK